jgi:hypothetical protein
MPSLPLKQKRKPGDTAQVGSQRQLPPEIAAKLAGMSEAERQAFFAERRAAREARRAAGAAAEGQAAVSPAESAAR